MPVKPKVNLFPHESFPYRLELKDRTAWFMCQEHMDKEIAKYKLRPKDYKKSCKRGYKIVSEKTVVKKKTVSKKREDILSPSMKSKTIKFAEDTTILNPRYK
tara:strand:+ start:353 stop:658 length:306 start_codon:yes stop_codon:yes gene_type:complete